MNDLLYGRKLEVVTPLKKFTGDELTINFTVPFDDGAEPNIANVEIYNLTDKTINNLKTGNKVYINAGYQNDVGTIFTGTIQGPQTVWQTVDKVFSFDALDSGETWFKTMVKKTYAANISAKQILNDLLKLTGLKVGALSLPTDKIYKGGKTCNGTLATVIAELVRDCGAKVHVNKNAIFIRPKNAGDNIRFVLNADRGLIGSPTRTEKEVVTGKDKKGAEIKKTVSGWKITSLLNHRITTDSILEIESKTAKGTFRVESGRHIGNASSFYTEMEVYPL